MIVGVGNVDPVPPGSQCEAGGLGELRLKPLSVTQAGLTRADPSNNLFFCGVKKLEPVIVGVGHSHPGAGLEPEHAEVMLQAGLLANPIGVTEGEEVPRRGILATDKGGGAVAFQVDCPDRAALAVGDEELAVSNAQARWLGPGGQEAIRGVAVLLTPRPAEVIEDPLLLVVGPDLVGSSHGDVDLFAVDRDIPGRAEPLLRSLAAAGIVPALHPVTGESRDRLRLEIDDPQGVVLAVGDIQELAIDGQALKPVEPGRIVAAITQPDTAAADHLGKPALEICHHDSMVVGIADEEPLAWRINRQLAGETQR